MRIEAAAEVAVTQPRAATRPGGFADLLKTLANDRPAEDARRGAVEAMREAAAGQDARTFLSGLSTADLAILQEEAHLAAAIRVESLSAEGAENLIRDRASLVDLNNDGIIERGAAKIIAFPPVNAPASVKEAWTAATAGMSRRDAATLELQLALPFTLQGQHGAANPKVVAVGAGTYDWGAHMAAAIAGHDISKSANMQTAIQRECWEELAKGLQRFQRELQARGLA